MRCLITDAEDWRYALLDGDRQFVLAPHLGAFGPRAQLTVYEDDGNDGWEAVIVNDFSPSTLAEFGDYCVQLAKHLEGKEL